MKRLFQIILIFTLNVIIFAPKANAQSTDRDYIRLGNKQYRKALKDNDASGFTKALTNYTKALEKSKSVEAFYNFGCASLAHQQDSTANAAYLMADSLGFTNPLKRAKNFHNMGNIWYLYGVQQMRSNGKETAKAFQNAVNLYKSSLRCNPNDDETRYNLAMAQYQLKKNQNNNGGGGGNDNNKDKDKDKKDQNKDQQKQQQQKQQQQQQQQQQQKDQMSDQAAEQLLNSAQQDERSVQQKVKATPQKRRSLEKDW